MRETDKSARRRMADPVYRDRYLVGQGIDIGAGETPLSDYAASFPRMQAVRAWDLADGDAQDMATVADESFDFVHSSHCLEHMVDARAALRHWIRILKPGGYLIVTVPDEDLYEHGRWPSRFNADHKWSFSISKPGDRATHALNVVDLLREFGADVTCERITLCGAHFDEEAPADVDQTLGEAECAIEWVWRRNKDVASSRRSAAEWLQEAVMAELAGDDVCAEGAYRRACDHPEPSLDAFNEYGHLLTRLRRYDEVEQLWRQAVQRWPHDQVRVLQALFLMQRGKYRQGFRIREASVADIRRTPTLPPASWRRWQGERLAGRSVAIWTEFGLGDEIMFSRFAADLKQQLQARSVAVVCQDPLYHLLRDGLHGADAVLPVSRRDELPEPDFWVFPHSIPVYRPLTTKTIPSAPYLTVPPHRRQQWRRRLDLPERGLKVGLSWHGAPTHENDPFRSLASLAMLDQLLHTTGVQFVSLQKGRGETEAIEREQVQASFRAVGHEFDGLDDPAAVIANLDLVITVDTSIAHLAGALGCPTWLMLPAVCDWRWLLEREDSPWYPSIRIFRQERLGDWQPVFDRIQSRLEDLRRDTRPAEVA